MCTGAGGGVGAVASAAMTPESCPSNAFAVWHVDTAVMVGWGVTEEGGMIGLVQKAAGVRGKAKLVGGVKGVVEVEGGETKPLAECDAKRLEQRRKKFSEMQKMGWDPGTVSIIIEEQREERVEKSSIHIGH